MRNPRRVVVECSQAVIGSFGSPAVSAVPLFRSPGSKARSRRPSEVGAGSGRGLGYVANRRLLQSSHSYAPASLADLAAAEDAEALEDGELILNGVREQRESSRRCHHSFEGEEWEGHQDCPLCTGSSYVAEMSLFCWSSASSVYRPNCGD